jgi:precorrin-3B C17-methyltransferase
VGIGPGSQDLLTLKAIEVIKSSDYVIGHTTYVNRIKHLVRGEIIESGMGREVERVKLAVKLARDNVVSLISGGDPSVYGMLPLVVEYIIESGEKVKFEVVPGVTALSSASPLLGSPISGDHAVISLSDLLIPWEVIEKRLRHALQADFVIAIYNPSSRKRAGNLVKALQIVLQEKGDVFIGIVKNATREGEEIRILKATDVMANPELVDMNTLLIIPSSETLVRNGVMYTPRGYSRKYRLVEDGKESDRDDDKRRVTT